jgi:RHS repeat-associated protein
MRTGAADPLWLLGDHLGSTSVVANYDGTLYAGQGYKAWGEWRYSRGVSPLPTTFRYTGERESESFGLYFYGARWYDGYLNRWVQPDSVIPDYYNPQDWDRYSYARNNPIKYTDPSGHSVDCGLGDPYCKAGKLDVTKRANDLLNGLIDQGDNRTWKGLTDTEQSILNEGGILKGVFDDARNGANAKDMAYVWYDPINLVLIIFTGVRIAIIAGPVVSAFIAGVSGGTAGSTPWPSPWNGPQIINGITYSYHALVRMMPKGFGGRGIPPSVIENALQYGDYFEGKISDTVVIMTDDVAVVWNYLTNTVVTAWQR